MTGKNALKSKGRDDQMKSAVPDKDETPTKELDWIMTPGPPPREAKFVTKEALQYNDAW